MAGGLLLLGMASATLQVRDGGRQVASGDKREWDLNYMFMPEFLKET